MKRKDDPFRMDRRDFLRFAGFGAAALFSGGVASSLSRQKFGGGDSNVRISLSAEPGEYQILAGQATRVQHYVGQVISGPASTIETIPGSFLGPIIRLRKGDNFQCDFTNNLVDQTILHWHGMNVPDVADGHPRYSVQPNNTYSYSFPVINRAGTYWYHPHPDGDTGTQVYAGQAGLMIVSDNEEQSLPLPRGEFDVPLVLQDKAFDTENQFQYGPNPFLGAMGDKILVNGKHDFVLSAAQRVYRLRILNGSTARVYKLNWSNLAPIWVIGTDGGLLDKPRNKPYITLSPGERVELWADFSRYPVGTQITLKSREITGLTSGFGGGGGGVPLPNGAACDVMRVSIDREDVESLKLPKTLTNLTRHNIYDAVNASSPRRFAITFDGMFLVNGAPFDMLGLADNEMVQNNTLEVWEFTNTSGDALISHPMHVHGPQFQVIKRTMQQSRKLHWERVRYGYTDEGWKDVVMLMPGETVRFLIKFGPYPGLFLYHCHNLEHEDMGMMRNYLVQ